MHPQDSESVMRRLDTVLPEKPLGEAWMLLSRTGGVAPVINEDDTPYGLITGRSIFNFLGKLVGPHPKFKEMKVSELFDISCRQAADTQVASFQATTRIRDVINKILRQEGDDFWVLDENGRYAGICRQKDILNAPKLKLILVDHNEPHQALGSLEEAEILEILDHHRLGNPSTHIPIKFTVDVVGSTGTLISERIEDAGLSAPTALAGMMLGGLLSDTLVLTSPTTTNRDRAAAERLARWAFVRGTPLENETIKSYGQDILKAGAGLTSRSPREVVTTDLKIYKAADYEFAIAQAEVSDLHEVTDHIEPLNHALDDLRDSRGLDFSMLMVTDVVGGSSRILVCSGAPPLLDDLPYVPLPDGTRLAEGIVSRKKQLLPTVLSLLER